LKKWVKATNKTAVFDLKDSIALQTSLSEIEMKENSGTLEKALS
jgi:hypothetical protein